jgi:hypothetical protein
MCNIKGGPLTAPTVCEVGTEAGLLAFSTGQ